MLNVTPAVKEFYPGLVIGTMTLKGFSPHEESEFDTYLDSRIAGIKQKHLDYDRKSACLCEPMCHYVKYFKAFRKTYPVMHQLESLILKDRGIPKASSLFEAMFLSELDNLLLTAGHDLGKLTLPLTLDVGDGSDITYAGIFGRESHVAKGDLYLSDANSVLSTILMGPDEKTKITDDTSDVLYFVYGVPGISESYMRGHLESILNSIRVIMPELDADTISLVRV